MDQPNDTPPSARIINGDSIEVLRAMPENSIDAVVCDPPYGLSKQPDMAEVLRHWLAGDDYQTSGGGFMGKTWDSFVPGPALWREVLRVLKPGGHCVAFFGTRTYDLGVLAMRLAGFEVRDQIAWVYGCLDEETKAVTKDGPKHYLSIRAGDLVLCYDSSTKNYSYQPVLEVVEYDYCDTAFRLVGDFGEQVVSRNHRCLTERSGREVFQLAETLQREACVPFLEDLPELQQALRDQESYAGETQCDLQSCLYGCTDFASKSRIDRSVGTEEGPNSRLRRLRDDKMDDGLASAEGRNADLQQEVQRYSAREGIGETRGQGARCLVSERNVRAEDQNDGTNQPSVEGRPDVPESQGCLRKPAHQVCSMPGVACQHVACRRVRNGASTCSCVCDGTAADPAGGCSPRQPRRDGQPLRELDGVRIQQRAQGVRAWRGHRTSLVRVVPFHYTGKVWCLRVPTGAFVAVRGGVAFPTGNSGFPKSLDVSKAIDKQFGVARKVVGQSTRAANRTPRAMNPGGGTRSAVDDGAITAPATPEAAAWSGFGTAMKPAQEPIVLARKPLEGTVAANILKHGTGGLNIDGCRIGTSGGTERSCQEDYGPEGRMDQGGGQAWRTGHEIVSLDKGRWPANLITDGSDPVLELFPGEGEQSAARFFYCAKPSRGEREAGLEAFKKSYAPRDNGVSEKVSDTKSPRANIHPTVKPIALMRYLCRLVTPPGGVVLDPFLGSGTTGCAAALEGFRFVGIEREAEYVAIAETRIAHWSREAADAQPMLPGIAAE